MVSDEELWKEDGKDHKCCAAMSTWGMKSLLAIAFALIASTYFLHPAHAFSAPVDQQRSAGAAPQPETAAVITTSFSRTIQADSQKVEETWQAKLDRLWNDPRPFTEAFDDDALTLTVHLGDTALPSDDRHIRHTQPNI